MSYIILNGTNSDNVTGLLIQKLPPIIKPAQRVEIEEIDGRAGDIITPLGYSAYDRELLIGLRWNYDIDEIIAFFDGAGQVIFSNEPDKVYDFRIYEQVDYEALGRLKSANVIFHCQPFKHSATEGPETLTAGDNTVTNSGNIYSRPTITIEATGTVGIYLNGSEMLSIEFGETSQLITIDLEEMNAYSGTDLMNRSVTGDYSAFRLPVGSSTINLDGSVTSATIEKYSRWI